MLGPRRLVAVGLLWAAACVLGFVTEWFDVPWLIESVGFASVVVLLGIVLLHTYLDAPRLEVNFDSSEVRHGSALLPFARLIEATAVRRDTRGRVDWQLNIGEPSNAIAVLTVRSQKLAELTSLDRQLVAEVLRRSAVTIPHVPADRYDPMGTFAWLSHPNHLSRDEAIDYVLNTPKSGEPTRARTQGKTIWIDED